MPVTFHPTVLVNKEQTLALNFEQYILFLQYNAVGS